MEDILDHYVNREGAKEDTAFILGELNQVFNSIKKVRDTKLTLGDASGFRATVSAAKDAAKAIEELTKAEDKLTRAQQQNEKQRILGLKAAQEEEKLEQQSIKTKKLKGDQLAREAKEQEKLAAAKAKADASTLEIVPGDLGATKDATEAIKEQGDAVEDLRKKQAELDAQSYALSGNQTTGRKKQTEDLKSQAVAVQETTLKYDKYTGTLQTNLEIISRNNIALKNNKAAQSDINRSISDTGKVTDKQVASLAALKEEEILLQNENKKLSVTTKLQAQEFTSSIGSIDKTRAQLELLRNSYDELSVAEKRGAFGKGLRAEITTTEKSLVKLEKQAGISARSTTNVFTQAYGAVRKLANIIPGLGLAGVVLILLEPFKQLINYFADLFRTVDKTKIAIAALNEVNVKAVETFAKEKSTLDGLLAVVRDNTIALNARQEALKQLIALNPEYLKGLTLENIATDEGRKLLDKYVEALQAKSELQAAQDVQGASNKAVADLKAEKAALEAMSKAGTVAYDDLSEAQRKFLDNSTSAGRINFTASLLNLDISKSDIDQVLKNFDKEIAKASIKVDASVGIFKDKFAKSVASQTAEGAKGIIKKLKDEIERLDKERPDLLTEKLIKTNVDQRKKLQEELDRLEGKEDKPKKAARVRESTKAELDSDYELRKLAFEKRQILIQNNLKNERLSLNERIALLTEYNEIAIKLIDAQEANELNIQQKKLAAQEANLKKAKGTERNNLLIEVENTRTAINTIESKYDNERLVANLKFSDELSEAFDKAFETRKKKMQEEYERFKKFEEQKRQIVKDKIDLNANEAEISKAGEFEVAIATAIGKKRERLERKLQRDIEDIRNKARIQQLILEERQLEAQREFLVAFGLDTTTIDEKITQKQIDQSKIRIANTKAEYDEKNRIRDENLDTVLLYETEALEIIETLQNAQFTKQKNALQEQIDLEEKKKNDKIDAVNKELISEEEKVAKIKIIEATAQANRERLEARQRRLDYERAKFEKAFGIMRILLEIGIALAKQQYQAAALAGVALIKAIATPIPKFGKGKDKRNKYTGLAEVDEAGKTEIIYRAKTNSLEMATGAAKPRLTFLDRDDIVYPSAEALLTSTSNPYLKPIKDNEQQKENGMRTLADAIDNLEITTQLITKSGWRKQNMKIDEYKNWVDKNVRN